MAVRPESLETPERGLALDDRRGAPAPSPQPDEDRELSAMLELEQLRERIAAAKSAEPPKEGHHCRDCFLRGWRAAIAAIEGA